MKHLLSIMLFLFLVSLSLGGKSAFGQDDVEALREEIAEQKKQLNEQIRNIEALERKLNDVESKEARVVGEPDDKTNVPKGTQFAKTTGSDKGTMQLAPELSALRDTVGDLNAAAVKAGEFPGSIRIPGTDNVSLAIGGFLKTAAIFDSDAENMGADFLPALLGTQRPDKDGGYAMDATLTRLFMDGRAPMPKGKVRGYVEADLNSTNNGSLGVKIRQAYGAWTTEAGTLVAGQTWSTLMDLKILPEDLTEPTASGVIFQRQPIIQWSQSLNPLFTYHLALEDASSNDVFSEQPSLGVTSFPDVVAGLEFATSEHGHLRLNGIVREIQIDLPDVGTDEAVGWGLTLSGHLKLLEKDKAIFSGAYGEGLGRYLLGIPSTAGGALYPADNEISLRDNWGLMLGYAHHWTETLRSTVVAGYAKADPLDWQAGDTFESSRYTSVNLLWSVQPFLTIGIEYKFGIRENKDDSDLDNHRIGMGIQVF